MPQPAVSVVIATRGRSALLRAALKSIAAQTYRGDIDAIVVVDQEQVDRIDVPPTDGCTLRVVQNSRSPGLPGARNTGLLMAQTPIVAFCDDDDEWAPDKLERQVPRLGRSGEIAVGSGLMIVRDGRPSVVRLAKASRLTHADFVRHRNMEVHPSSLIFSRERLLSEVGLVDECIPGGYAEDYEYMLRVTGVSDMAVVPEPLVRVRWHEGSWFNDRWDTISAALRYLLAKHPAIESSRRGYGRIAGQIAFSEAAQHRAGTSLRWGMSAWRAYPLEARVYLSFLVAARIVDPLTIANLVRRAGRGM
jgi:glycosyltransferase involved in cell wall biosynthesis